MPLIQGRPTIDRILERANAPQGARFIAQRLQRVSPLLQLLEFDNSVIPNGRSGRIVFPYSRGTVARVAQLRAYYSDYVPQHTTGRQDVTAILRPMGDAFEIDRVFARADAEYVEEQIDGMAPGINNLFCDLSVNGDPAQNALEFEGLSSILEGTAQEMSGTGMNFSATVAATAEGENGLRENVGAIRREVVRMRGLGLTPIILSNEQAMHRLSMVGERLGFLTRTPDMFGTNEIDRIAGAYMIDAGEVQRVTGPAAAGTGIVPTVTAEVIPVVGGLTDIYIVGISRTNGFCGVTLDSAGGTDPIRYETARTDAGVLRRFEAEFVGGVALLDERAAVVFRDVRVAPAA